MINFEHVYHIGIDKLSNPNSTREGLRKFVLLNNFIQNNFIRKFEINEDLKKGEEDWLDSCLDGLVEEEEDGYVFITRSNDTYDGYNSYNDYLEFIRNDGMDFEVEVAEDIMIPQTLGSNELTHIDPGGCERMDIDDDDDDVNEGDYNYDNYDNYYNHYDNYDVDDDDEDEDVVNTPIDSPVNSLIGSHFEEKRMLSSDNDINMLENAYGTLTNKDFHPYWKDNSIIVSPSFLVDSCRPFFDSNNSNNRIPRIFQRYRFTDLSSQIDASILLDLLSKDPPQHFLKRSKDDLDILGSLGLGLRPDPNLFFEI